MEAGFDNSLYIHKQTEHIRQRIAQWGGKLYLEFGGKLFDDYHAARVLPGFDPNGKIRLLYEMREQAEIIFTVSAGDIEKTKMRADLGISYDMEVLRLIDDITHMGIRVNSVVITQYTGQAAADGFAKKLTMRGVKNYIHRPIKGYPTDIAYICSDEGYGANPYIETSRPLVVVTAPGPGSGKLATCLSQVYHEIRQGRVAGYAKFETFPIWNLPLKHPVNLAYEAATADLADVNMIDPFHLEAYGVTTVNYNRDVEVFPVLAATFEKITGSCPYQSPTDMGVNMAGKCIVDDEAVCAAARQEIVRRYYTALCDRRVGAAGDELVNKLELLMQQAHVDPSIRPVVAAAAQVAEETGNPAGAIELPSGEVVTGKTTDLMGASSATLLNALKRLAGIDHQHHLISREAIEPIQAVKVNHLGSVNPRLHSDETLIALAISATTNPLAKRALDQLSALRGCEAHSTVILSPVDSGTYSRLGLRLTCEPQYETNKLYHK